MKSATLRMSKLDMLAGGIWKFETVQFIAAPCSTKREAIWLNTTEYSMVHSQMGSNLSMHFTSSTCEMGQRRHGLWQPCFRLFKSLDVMYAALSKNLHQTEIRYFLVYYGMLS